LEESLSRADGRVEVQYLPMGVHQETGQYAWSAIQKAVDSANPDIYHHVLIGYGLCNYGVRGLRARQLPLVLPRRHDCISLLLGSQQRYEDLLQEEPSTYFQSSGWVDAAAEGPVQPLGIVGTRLGNAQDLTSLIAKYGEDNGRFLFETLRPRAYAQHVYLTTGTTGEQQLLERCQETARQAGCPLRIIEGTTQLLDALVHGPWPEEEFLVVPPGKEVDLTYDEGLLRWKDPSP
jgi:hypothetical protein